MGQPAKPEEGASIRPPPTRRVRGRLERGLRLSAWFPHVPLAVAVGVLGGLQIIPAAEQALGLQLRSAELGAALRDLALTGFRGAPRVVVGSLLLVMTVGLLLRSRLAWVITVLVTAASLGLALLAQTAAVPSALAVYSGILLILLLASRRYFARSSLTAATLFALTSVLGLLSYAVLGSYTFGQGFAPPIDDLVKALYFAVVTMSTVGYGDITPKTAEARLFVSSVIILGITVFATSLTAILAPLVNRRIARLIQTRGETMERSGHYVIVGDTALARNSFKELRDRKQKVALVLSRTPKEGAADPDSVVVGDASDLDVLRRADADKAKAVLALTDDDSENAFVILAVKELGGSARTVAAVNDSRNLERVRRVQPDLVIAPQVLGAEILAMALSGEEYDSESLVNRLLHYQN